jgi:hypothetical protein
LVDAEEVTPTPIEEWPTSNGMRVSATLGALLMLSALSLAQVSIAANLDDGTGSIYRTAHLHFQLQNCGANIPVTTGTTLIVQDTFDLRPATPGATITGTIIGNDQILCGNVASTFYLVTIQTLSVRLNA